MALFIGRLPNDLNIDFVGGTAYGANLVKNADMRTIRAMLDEESQKELLAGVTAEQVDSEGRRFDLAYPAAGGAPAAQRTVSLSNVPPGATDEERAEVVRARAAQLPDVSVEIIYTREEQLSDAAGSRHFNIRTTEKEPDLVQVTLDRLLRDESGSLLKKTTMEVKPQSSRARLLTFWDDTGAERQPASGSPSFVKTLLTRELRRHLELGEKEALPFVVEVAGAGNTKPDGTFHTILVSHGDLSESDAKAVTAALQSSKRAFDAYPQPDRLENFDSQLAAETRLRALWAILASWAAILFYVWFRFGNWTFGLAAVLCLVHDVMFTLGAVAVCHYIYEYLPWIAGPLQIQDFKLDLPSVAAILTLVGYSINDKIVVYDRMREVRGKNPKLTPQMINDSINQALSRTVLTGLSVMLVLGVLYFFGGEGIHLFAFVMLIGLVVGTYSSIYIASPLLLMFGEGREEEPRAGESRAVPERAGV
jgi:SecD/SecF fusion protein